jgi:hypothetical protein
MPTTTEIAWSEQTFLTFNPHKPINRKLYILSCESCGYEVEEDVVPPAKCPRCHAHDRFTRVMIPGSILAQADEFPEGADPRIGFARQIVVRGGALLRRPEGSSKVGNGKFKFRLPNQIGV